MSLRKNALPASPPDHLSADGARNLAVTWRSPTGVLPEEHRDGVREGGGRSGGWGERSSPHPPETTSPPPAGIRLTWSADQAGGGARGGGSTSSALFPQDAVMRDSLQGGRP